MLLILSPRTLSDLPVPAWESHRAYSEPPLLDGLNRAFGSDANHRTRSRDRTSDPSSSVELQPKRKDLEVLESSPVLKHSNTSWPLTTCCDDPDDLYVKKLQKKTVPKRTGSRYFFPANGPWWTWLAWKMSVMASGGHKILEAILKSNLANLEVEENHLRRWGLRIDSETLWGNISTKHVFCEADLSAVPASRRERRNEKEVQTKQQGWLKWVWFQHILTIHMAVGDYLAPNLVKIYRWYVGRLYCLSMFVLYQQKNTW